MLSAAHSPIGREKAWIEQKRQGSRDFMELNAAGGSYTYNEARD